MTSTSSSPRCATPAYRQPEWYRYVAAFAGQKDVVVVENPYGGVVPELIELLAEGRGTTCSGSPSSRRPPWAQTCRSRTAPGWAASSRTPSTRRTFWRRRSRPSSPSTSATSLAGTANEVAVVFSVESTRALVGQADASDNTANATDESVVVPYRVVTRTLSEAAVPFDVVIWADGVTAPDRSSVASLRRLRDSAPPRRARHHARSARRVGGLSRGRRHRGRHRPVR